MPDTGVPFRDLVPKPPLLPLHGITQAGDLAFLQGQPSDVGPVRRADEVREHVDVAKRLRNQRLVSRWVSENGPIGSRNITCIGRGPPQGAQRSDIPGGIKSADRGPVPVIEGLIQQLGSHVLAVGQADGETMKGVVGGIQRPQANFAQEAADLVGGQSRPYNRTVEALTEIPDPPAAGGTGGVHT